MKEFIATCSMSLPSGVPELVHLFPFGTVLGRDGRGPYTLRDKEHAAEVITNTKAYQRGADLPVDYEHQNQLAPLHVKPRPAAGWVKADSLEVGPNGIWGRAEWTYTAAQQLGERAYRYLSPVFAHAQDGTVLRIAGAGLTHFPNLELTALASQGATMPGDTLTSAKALLGLDGADDATFLQTCGDLAKLTQAFVKHLALPPETGAAGVMAALMKRTTTATASQSPEVADALAAIQAVASQAEAYRKQVSQAQVDKAVDAAMTAGKVSPAMRPWAIALASQDPASFDSFLDSMPSIFTAIVGKSDFEGRSSSPPLNGGNPAGLTDSQLAVCSQMGMSPEEYSKTLKG